MKPISTKNEEMLPYSRAAHLFIQKGRSLHWRVSRGNRKAGDLVGSVDRSWGGYRRTTISGRNYVVHRISYLLAYKKWPQGMVDHIDGDRENNAPSNLRPATNAQNQWNVKGHGKYLKGVSKRKRITNPYIAQITVNGNRKNLGSFPTEWEAHRAYCEIAREAHGEYFNSGV